MYKNLITGPAYLAAKLKADQDYKRLLEEGHDFIIPPIESPVIVPERMMGIMANEKNWANDYIARGFVAEVVKMAKTKVIIGIADTGAEYISQYLSGAWLPELATDHTGEGKRDGHGHSHLCAGNIAADHPTIALGVIRELVKAGLVRLVPKKALRNNGTGSNTEIDATLVSFGAMKLPSGFDRLIVSCSFGGPSAANSTRTVVKQLCDAGIFVTASAGNSGGSGTTDTMGYPAKYDDVFSVGALEMMNNDPLQVRRSSYSSVGPKLFGTAPGSNILSVTNTTSGLAYWNGTSGSNPIFASMLACILCMYPEINTMAEAETFLLEFITDITASPSKAGHDWFTGYGAPVLSPYIDKDPIEDPNPNPDPIRNTRVLNTSFSGFKMLWRRESEATLRTLQIPSISVKVTTNKYSEIALDELSAQIKRYFTNRAIVLLNNQDVQDATWWTAKFLEYVSTNEGSPVSVTSIEGIDETGRKVVETDFTKRPDTTASLYDIKAAALDTIIVENLAC